ncbi:MAG TPA: type II secretion system F family protein, partial [Actinobacteria bacterium]|nr:type II secretion system F family protein [Actinomycetota bacterium]
MSTYVYKVRDIRGIPSKGELEADDRSSVAADLRGKGYTILDIREKSGGFDIRKQLLESKRIKSKDITIFSRQFATMINSGLAMLRALSILEDQTPNKKLKAIIGKTRADVEAGAALSEAMEKHPAVFNRLYVSMVKAGETGGILDDTLNRIATQLESEDSLKRMIRSAMVYPLLIAVFALLVMMAMMLFIIPVFSRMYADLDSQLP